MPELAEIRQILEDWLLVAHYDDALRKEMETYLHLQGIHCLMPLSLNPDFGLTLAVRNADGYVYLWHLNYPV
jgi:WD40 repeat protein